MGDEVLTELLNGAARGAEGDRVVGGSSAF